MAEESKKILLSIELSTDELKNKIVEAKKQLQSLKEENKSLSEQANKALKEGAIASYDELTKKIVENEQAQRGLKTSQRESQQQLDAITKANNAQTGSITQLRANVASLVKDYANLGAAERASAEGQAMLESLKGQNEQLKKLEGAYGDNRRNVGNYTQSILEANEATKGFGSTLKSVAATFSEARAVGISAMSSVTSAVNDAGVTFTSFTKGAKEGINSIKTGEVTTGLKQVGSAGTTAFLSIGRAIAATGIGLIVAGIALLINYMRSLQPVVDAVERGMAAVGAVIDTAGKFVYNFFTNIKSVGDFFSKFSFSNIIKGFQDFGKEASNAANAAIELTKAKQHLEDMERDSIKIQGDLRRAAGDLRTAENDRTKSYAERIKASDEASKLEKQLLEEQKTIVAEKNRLAQNELAEAEKKAGGLENVNREIRLNAAKTADALADIEDQISDKDAETIAESSKIRNQQFTESQAAIKANIAEELRIQEFYGAQTIEIKKQAALAELNSVLGDTNASNATKATAQKKYNNDILILDATFRDEQAKLRKEANDKAFNELLQERNRQIDFESRARNAQLAINKANAGEGISEQFRIRLEEINTGYQNEIAAQNKNREDALLASEQATNKELEALQKDQLFKQKSVSEQQEIINGIVESGRKQESDINNIYNLENLATVDKHGKEVVDATLANEEKRLQALQDQKKLELESGTGNEFVIRNEQLALQEQAEIAHQQKLLGDTEEFEKAKSFIEAKYNKQREDLERERRDRVAAGIGQTLKAAQGLYSKGSQEYKALAVSGTIVDTYRGATAALAPPPTGLGPVYGIPLAAITVATGLANIAKINETKTGFWEGGFTGHGTIGVDDKQINVSGYEYVLNPNAVKAIGVENLNRINFKQFPARNRTVSAAPFFADGGFTSGLATQVNNNVNNDKMDTLIDAVNQMKIVVPVEQIQIVSENQARVAAAANI